MQELAVEFGEGFQHVKYEAVLQQLRLFSFAHRRTCGDLTSFMVFWNFQWNPFSTIQPVDGYAATLISLTKRRGFQSSNSEALQNTPGRLLAASIPTSVQITYPLSQLIIPFADRPTWPILRATQLDRS